jgi:type I restriction enzyme S subunit
VSYPLKELGKVCKLVRGPFGGSLKKDIFIKEGYAVYEQQHAIYNQFSEIRYFISEEKFNEMSRFELYPNDLIMSCSGTMGKVAIVPSGIKKGVINQALLKLTPTGEIDIFYLKWLMTSSYFQEELDKFSVGAAIQNVASVSTLKQIKIPLPPLATQQKIVAKLDAIFAEIDKATAAAEANAKNAEALFQSYLSEIFQSDNSNFISKRIGEIGEIFSGSGFPVNQQGLLNEEIPFYKVSDMNLVGNERHMISHNNSVSRETAKQLGAKVIPAKSVIFPKIGGAIATNKKRILSIPSCVDNNVMGIYPNDKLVNPEFFFHLLNSIKLSSFANEAALPSIKKSTVEERLVKIPNSLSEQERICDIIESIQENSYKLKDCYFKKLNSLLLLKQSILKQAFNGELVKE